MEQLRITVLTPERTSLSKFWRDFLRYRDLLFLLVWRDISIRYRQTALGLFWVLLQPLSAALIFAFCIGRLAKIPSDGLPYLAFAYSGMVIWGLFAQSMERASGSIVGDERLITKVYFPRWIIPLSTIGSTLVDFTISVIMLFILLLAFGIYPGWHVLLVLPAVLQLLIFTASLGLLAAALNAKYRDIRYLTTFGLQLLLFMSPIFYSYGIIPLPTLWIWYLNPVTGPIELFRLSVTGAGHFYLTGYLLSLAVSLVLIVISVRVFNRMEDDMVDTI